jgi:CYTH domain-containing protein
MPPVEIERKYVIVKPDTSVMKAQESYTSSEISQTYLTSAEGVTHRVRKRVYGDSVVYTETVKVRIDKISSYEDEREIDEAQYLVLLEKKREGSVTLKKTRHTFDYLGVTFEVDVYPEWERTCILETELIGRDEEVSFPEFIKVVKEVSGEKRYTNASMSHAFPKEIDLP